MILNFWLFLVYLALVSLVDVISYAMFGYVKEISKIVKTRFVLTVVYFGIITFLSKFISLNSFYLLNIAFVALQFKILKVKFHLQNWKKLLLASVISQIVIFNVFGVVVPFVADLVR